MGATELETAAAQPSNTFGSYYHRIDLATPRHTVTGTVTGPVSMCSMFGTLATMDRTTIKFGPEQFNDPFGYLENTETTAGVNALNTYMDGKGAADNSWFKNRKVLEDVYVTSVLDKFWTTGAVNPYTLWRYVGTKHGTFRKFPGAISPPEYDPTFRPWFRSAMANVGQYTVSTPYKDSSGAGLVITLAHTIRKAGFDADYRDVGGVAAVMGIDFTLGTHMGNRRETPSGGTCNKFQLGGVFVQP